MDGRLGTERTFGMMGRKERSVVSALVMAMMVVGVPAVCGAKTSKKRVVAATVAGKHVKWSGRYLSFTQNESGFIIVGTKVRAAKTIGIGCPVLLSAQTYPVTIDTYCSGQYAEHSGKRYWFNTGGPTSPPFQVTFDSFDGTIVEGHFSGTLPPLTGATTPVTVDGTFRGALNGQ